MVEKPRILIVDDNIQYLDSLERALYTCDVVKASSLVAAQQACTADMKLALVDVRLSETDFANREGIQLLAWIRERFPTIPVIIMSGYTDHDAAVSALNLGAERYMKKPIRVDELLDVVAEFTNRGGSSESTQR